MLIELLSQQIIAVLCSVYADIKSEMQNGSIDIYLDDNTKIHIHGMKQLQKGKTYILVQVLKSMGDIDNSRSFYIDETNPSSIKSKLKFLLTKKGW